MKLFLKPQANSKAQRAIAVFLLMCVLLSGRGEAQEMSRARSPANGFGTVTFHVSHLAYEGVTRQWPLEPGEIAFVTLRRTSAPPGETFRVVRRTDADGNVTFDGLPHGNYTAFGETGRFSGVSRIYLDDYNFEPRRSLRVEAGQAFRGRVVNVRGDAVAGAVVTMRPQSMIDVRGRGPSRFDTTTEGDGSFTFQSLWGSDEWSCFVEAEGYAPSYQSGFGLLDAPLTVELKRGSSVTGSVVEKKTGSPVAGARVELRGRSVPYFKFETTTGPEGEFRIKGVGGGKYSLEFEHERLAPDLLYTHFEVSDGSDSRRHVLYAVAGATLRGRVYDRETQLGIPGVAMEVRTNYSGARSHYDLVTDGEGYYEARGLNTAEYSVTRGQSESHVNVYRHNKTRIEVVVGEVLEGIDFALDRGSRVSGRVVDGSGAPLAGVAIAADGFTDDHTIYKAAVLSNDSGEFTLYGFAPGTEMWLSARFSGYILKTQPKLSVGDADVSEVELVLSRRNAIRGVVVDASGEARTGVYVIAQLRDGGPGVEDWFLADMGAHTGEFEFPNISVGEYELVVWPNYYRELPTPTAEVTLRAGEQLEGIRLEYNGPKTYSIRGVIVDSANNPIRWAHLEIRGLHVYGLIPNSEKDGSFSMDHVPEGTWDLKVEKEGYPDMLVKGVAAGATGVRIVLGE